MLLKLVLKSAEGFAPAPDGDAALLRRFVTGQDETAFSELLQRHGPMVWSVCRHLFADVADAEDAFQATFLVLVRSAKKVRNGAAVGAWLHGTAVRIATQAKRAAARRRLREERAAGPEADRPVSETAWNELVAAVHEEVQNLPEQLRTVFVLCELEGVRQPDAAARLGWKPGTLTGRLTRARQQIVKRLAGRGLAPALAGGGLALGLATASAEVPIPMIDTALSMLRAGGTVPSTILNLMKEAPMLTMRSKLVAATVLFAGGLCAVLLPLANAQQPMGGSSGPPPAGGPPGSVGVGQPGFPGAGDPPPPGPGGNSFGPNNGPTGSGNVPPRTDSGVGVAVARMQQWEYKFVTALKDGGANLKGLPPYLKQFEELGNDGWEYCGPLPASSDVIVFKRPKPVLRGGGWTGGGAGLPGGGFPGMTPGAFGSPVPGLGSTGAPLVGVPSAAPGAPPGLTPGAGVGSPPPMAPDKPLTVVSLRNAAAADLGATLQQIFSNKLTLVAEPRTNSLILSGDKKLLEEAMALIEKLDVGVPTPPATRP